MNYFKIIKKKSSNGESEKSVEVSKVYAEMEKKNLQKRGWSISEKDYMYKSVKGKGNILVPVESKKVVKKVATSKTEKPVEETSKTEKPAEETVKKNEEGE